MAEENKEKPEQYDFKEAEPRIMAFWEKEKIYGFDAKSKKKIYSIDTPPPTVSGKMHIGHAFQYSQMDFMARFKRMNGFSVFYPFGTDDNGLPTERLVEKLNNVKSKSLSRMEFIELCLKTLKKITPDFINDWKKLAISCDYGLFYSTIDKHSQKLSQKSFIDLYKEGEIYKQGFPTLWCPECQTSIAQAELEDKELDSLFSTLKFSVVDAKNKKEKDKSKDKSKDGELLIATTRPELLPACVAVFVNPQDNRYKDLVGKRAKVPLFNLEVPIIADDSASIDKGTGAMMVCSYGDKYDAQAINKYKLTPKIVLNPDGTLNFGEYNGMKTREARKKILEQLKTSELVAEQKPIKHIVNVHDKCGTGIEFLPTEQWFIRILDKKEKLLSQGRKIKWLPGFMLKRYENWVNGLEWDWNISRDRHFGIPIPVWECKKCKEIIVAEEKELPIDPVKTKKICKKCKTEANPEMKVLDTWQTSSISPEIASQLVGGKIKQPYSQRCNGHDIIRTWDFYTITKSLMHQKQIPWENLMVSGFVTLQGEKMSKSKGNVIAPQEVTEKYGGDALRYWAASSSLGEDTDYQEKEVITGKKFVTKMFNASRFVFMNLNEIKETPKKPKTLHELDRLFIQSLNEIIKGATKAFDNYEYSKAKALADCFFWRDFCDNYLEIIKNRVYNGTKEEKESAQYTLYHSLLAILKLMAPITPFIIEEVYQKYYRKHEKDKSIHISEWPKEIEIKSSKDDSEKLKYFIDILVKVRQAKSSAQKSMKAEIILNITKKDKEVLKDILNDLKAVTNSKEIQEGKEFGVEFI